MSTLLKHPHLKTILIFVGAWLFLYLIPYETAGGAESKSLAKISLDRIINGGPNGNWQHCLAIPFIIGFLLWRYQSRYKKLVFNTSWWGAGFLIFSLFLYWLGSQINLYYLGYVAMHGIAMSFVLWLGGWRTFWQLSFFSILGFFFWPWYFIGREIGLPLRLLVTQMAEPTLNLLGLDTLKQGTGLLSAPTATLAMGEKFSIDVAAACSGLRSLMSLLLMSLIVGYTANRSPWSRALLFLSAFPLAVLGNVIRILILVYGSIWFGSDFAIGKSEHDPSAFHIGSGLVIFVFVFIGLMALSKVFQKYIDKPEEAENLTQNETAKPTAYKSKIINWLLPCIAIILTIIIKLLTPDLQVKPDISVRMELPTKVGSYNSEKVSPTPAELIGLPEDTQFVKRSYFPSWGNSFYDKINMGIVLSGQDRRSLHPPNECLIAQGWKIISEETRVIELSLEQKLPIRILSLSKVMAKSKDSGELTTLNAYYIYWWTGNNKVSADYNQMVKNHFSTMIRERVYSRWAYPNLLGFQHPYEKREETLTRLTRFLQLCAHDFQLSAEPF